VSTYETNDDTYCYPGTTVLKNRRNLRTQRALARFETAMTAQRFDEPLPNGRLSVRHFCAVHHHLFQDVYSWAGRIRSIRISKGEIPFAILNILKDSSGKRFANCKKEIFP
jgi:cell filamentation protein